MHLSLKGEDLDLLTRVKGPEEKMKLIVASQFIMKRVVSSDKVVDRASHQTQVTDSRHKVTENNFDSILI